MPSIVSEGEVGKVENVQKKNKNTPLSLLPNVTSSLDASDSDEENEDKNAASSSASKSNKKNSINQSPLNNANNTATTTTNTHTTTSKPISIYQCSTCRLLISDTSVSPSTTTDTTATVSALLNVLPLPPSPSPITCAGCKSTLGTSSDSSIFALDLSKVTITNLGKYHATTPSLAHLQVPFKGTYDPLPQTLNTRVDEGPVKKKSKTSPKGEEGKGEVEVELKERMKMLEDFLVFHEKRIKFLESKLGVKVKR